MAQVKAANKAIGNHWFERSTMRFFNSRIESGLLRGRFFITSERRELDFPKRYTVREVLADGDIKTVGEFQGYTDLELARIAVNVADCKPPEVKESTRWTSEPAVNPLITPTRGGE
jgi:hypothetical protein